MPRTRITLHGESGFQVAVFPNHPGDGPARMAVVDSPEAAKVAAGRLIEEHYEQKRRRRQELAEEQAH